MNVYHITHSQQTGVAHLHFWGCNLDCRACLLKKELYDCHLAETKNGIFNPAKNRPPAPERFLSLEAVISTLQKLKIRQVILMGAEPTIDPQLAALTEALHKQFGSQNVLLTNGLIFADLKHIDEVVFSIKAHTDKLHRDYTRKSNMMVLENFVKYCQSGVKLRAESIFIPEYIDCLEIGNISKFIASVDSSIPYRIDAYIPIGDNPWRRPTSGEMENAVSMARKHLDSASCLTGNKELKFEVLRVV